MFKKISILLLIGLLLFQSVSIIPAAAQNSDQAASLVWGSSMSLPNRRLMEDELHAWNVRYSGMDYLYYPEVNEISEMEDVAVLESDFVTEPMISSVGNSLSLALRSNGTVWAWGRIHSWWHPDFVPYPAQVEGLDNVTAISIGMPYSFAINQNGEVWRWMNALVYHYGTGNVVTYSPSQIPNLNDVIAISGGASGTVLRSDGSVWARVISNPSRVRNPDGIGYFNLFEGDLAEESEPPEALDYPVQPDDPEVPAEPPIEIPTEPNEPPTIELPTTAPPYPPGMPPPTEPTEPERPMQPGVPDYPEVSDPPSPPPTGSTEPTLPQPPVSPTEPTAMTLPQPPTPPTEPTLPQPPTPPTEPTLPQPPVPPTEPTLPEQPVPPTEPTLPQPPVLPTEPTLPQPPVPPTQPEQQVNWQNGNNEFLQGSDTPLIFVIEDLSIEDVNAIYVNDELLALGVHYTLESGSVIVSFHPNFLNTLGAGRNNVDIFLTNGEVLVTYFNIEPDLYDPRDSIVPTLPPPPQTPSVLAQATPPSTPSHLAPPTAAPPSTAPPTAETTTSTAPSTEPAALALPAAAPSPETSPLPETSPSEPPTTPSTLPQTGMEVIQLLLGGGVLAAAGIVSALLKKKLSKH